MIAIVSSFFKKDKNQKKTSRPQRPAPGLEKPKGEVYRGRLGDLVKELKTDFGDVFNEKSTPEEMEEDTKKYADEAPDHEINYEYRGYEQEHPYQQPADSNNKKESYSANRAKAPKKQVHAATVYDNEIGDDTAGYDITFDKKTLLQGIIMSEVLGKPKALRK